MSRLTLAATLAATASIGILAAIYPDRAIGTKARPDLVRIPCHPIIGDLLEILSSTGLMHHRLLVCHEEAGLTVTLTAPLMPRVIVTADPKNVEYFLKTNFDNYIKGDFVIGILKDFLGDGIFATDGTHWKYQRKTASRIFNIRNFRDFMSLVFLKSIKDLCKTLDASASSGEVDELSTHFYRMVFNSFGEIAFGIDFASRGDSADFMAAFDRTQNVIAKRFNNPFWKVTEKIQAIFYKNQASQDLTLIENYISNIVENRKKDSDAHKKSDLLTLFQNTKNEDGNLPTDKEVHEIVLNFLLAGRDTTASALSWAFYSLATNPKVSEKLYQEVKDFDETIDHAEMFEELRKGLKYTHAVWNETLRLYPVVPLNAKSAVNDDIFPDGTFIEAGTIICWDSWAMGRLEHIWGPEAKQFNPDRWLSPDFRKPLASEWPAFHAGPRTCLGQNMATLQGVLCIAMLTKRFTFELAEDPNQEKMYAATVTLHMKEPLKVRLKSRNLKV